MICNVLEGMVLHQENYSRSIFINEDAASFTPASPGSSGKMEILINSHCTPPPPLCSETRTESCSSSTFSGSSSETFAENCNFPTVEIHVYGPNNPHIISSPSQSSSKMLQETRTCQIHPSSLHSTAVLQTNVGPSESTENALTKLLPLQEIDAEFVEHEDDGRLGWKKMEKGIDGSDCLKCIGVEKACGDAEVPLQAMGRRYAETHENTYSKIYQHTDPLCHKIIVALKENMPNFSDEVTEKEIKQAILLSASMNKISFSHEEAGECASLIMEELIGESQAVKQYDPEGNLTKGSSYIERPESFTEIYIGSSILSKMNIFFRAHWRRVWIVMLWLATCGALFAWKFMQYRHHLAFEVMGYCLCTAKGAAETLKLNMALVLLPVCRNTLTWLRGSRYINSVIPFNDSIDFHKLIAGGIVIGIILHGGIHLACDFPRIANADEFIFQQTIADCFNYDQPSYVEILLTTEGVTGISMVILLLIAFLLATKPLRRQLTLLPKMFRWFTGFNAFWYSHHLFVAVYVLLIIHSMFLFLTKKLAEKTTWIYISIPVLVYVVERFFRIVRSENFNTETLKATVYPGKVLSLKLRKPAGFCFRSGMYVYVQCPEISRFEWHPYSITSAPCDDFLGLHIRSLGDWSYEIYCLFEEALVTEKTKFSRIFVDGPYGAASQDHAKYEVVLLIGLGIGATPFVSILKDIADNLQKVPSEDAQIGIAKRKKGIRKAYFYWVTREQGSFDWFRDIMAEISALNKNQGVIEMHNYLTSVYQEGDNRSALVSIVQALHFMKSGVDIISKTPVQTEFSRPNWSRVFCNLARRHGGERIGVFYCGPETLGKELEKLCHKMTIKSSARFVFHKEHY